MKKLLTLLGAVGLTATAGAAVVACGNPNKDKTVDISEFAKLVKAEANGKHESIAKAKEAIEKLDKPEGIEKTIVTEVKTSNIRVAFVASKGYKTPIPLVEKFVEKGQTQKISTDDVQTALDAKIKDKEFTDAAAAIAAAKQISLAEGLELAGEPTNSEQTITIVVKAKDGYVLKEGSETTFTAAWKVAETEVSTDSVQSALDAKVKDQEFADAAAAIAAAKQIALAEGLELTGEPTNSEQTITIVVKAKDGYVLKEGSETTFTAAWKVAETEVSTDSVQSALDAKVKDQKFKDAAAAIAAAKQISLAEGLELAGEPTNSEQTITIVVKAKDGYVLKEGSETTFTAAWKVAETEVSTDSVQSALDAKVKDQKFKDAAAAIAAAKQISLAEGLELAGEPTNSEQTITIVVKAKDGYVLKEGSETTFTAAWKVAETEVSTDSVQSALDAKVKDQEFADAAAAIAAAKQIALAEGLELTGEPTNSEQTITIVVKAKDGYVLKEGSETTFTAAWKVAETEVSTDSVQSALDAKVKDQEFADAAAAIAAAKQIALAEGLELTGEPTNSEQTITIVVKAKDGYVLKEGSETTFTAAWKVAETEVSTDSVQSALDAKVKDQKFKDAAAAIAAAKQIALAEGLELTGEPTNSEQTITIVVKAKDGYVLKEGSETTFTAAWKVAETEVSTDSVQSALDAKVKDQKFKDAAAAIAAAKQISLAEGLELAGEPTNSEQTITIVVKAKDGYVLKEGSETTFTAAWKVAETEVSTDSVQSK